MIGSLRGVVLERELDGVVLLEVAGVGYRVTVSQRALGELEPGTTAFLHVHHHIRDDAQQLFGFLARDERTTFQALLATHGVGPALAMAIVATHPPATLVDIVAEGDVGSLTLVPGVGKKTAERLMVELRDKLALPSIDPVVATGGGTSVAADVREALAGLGYGPEEIRDVLRQVPAGDDASVMLRRALELLGARRA